MFSTYKTTSPEETIELGRKLAVRLRLGDNVLLYGELGAGKTHFTKGLAAGFGIEATIKSPTFALVNQYQLGAGSWELGAALKHFDLYRLEEGVDLREIGLEEAFEDEHTITVVEWADRLGDQIPSHYVLVDLEGEEDKREIKISFRRSSSVSEVKIEEFYAQWQTPMHVREHCKQVASVAVQLGKAFVRAGEIVDLDLLNTSALLHDLCRVCDFRTMEKGKFEEEITDEKWNFWHEIRSQYEGLHHADIADNWLKEKGYFDTAEVIRLHRFRSIVEEQHSFDTFEKKIVHYSDKRAKHDQLVGLEERFRDARARYGKYSSESDKELFLMVEEKTVGLERELFESLDIDPKDIR